MFGKPIRIGRILGIDLTISWSFLALVAVLSLFFALRSPNFVLGLVLGVVSLGLVFASVLAHELGHSLVAQRLGIKIAEIELHFFGGAAKMLNMPSRPRDEILISAAGPAVSFALAGAFGGLSLLGVNALGIVGVLTSVNLMLGAFNLIPALPTDGGRILRAALTPRYGGLEATRIAVNVARVATLGIGIWGLVSGNFFTIGIAIFLWMLGTRELQIAQAFAGHQGYEPRGAQWSTQWSNTPRVEVFDRDGRFLTTAPGGVEVTPAPFSSSSTYRRMRTPSPEAKSVFVRGSDGRIWVVTQRTSAF